jgi:hypothetical protein
LTVSAFSIYSPVFRVDLTITSRNVALENIAETVVDNQGKVQSKASPQHR